MQVQGTTVKASSRVFVREKIKQPGKIERLSDRRRLDRIWTLSRRPGAARLEFTQLGQVFGQAARIAPSASAILGGPEPAQVHQPTIFASVA